MKVERVVVDTNVLISAAIMPKGKARATLDVVIAANALVMSRELYQELETRLARPKFDRYLEIEDRAEFMQLIASAAILDRDLRADIWSSRSGR